MQSRIHSKDIDLTDDQRAYIEERVERLKKYAGRLHDESTKVDVDIYHNAHKSEKNITLEITVTAPHAKIRSEVQDVTVEAAIDVAFEKLKKQVERFKSKNDRRHQSGKMMPEPTLEVTLSPAQEQPDFIPVGKISKRKVFHMEQPFSDAEAAEQMELLGHEFFMYISSDTGRTSVVYKRKDGNYGILEAEQT